MQHFCRLGNVADFKHPALHAFLHDALQVFNFLYVEFFPHIFHAPDVTEEIGTQRPVSVHDAFNGTQSREEEKHELIFGRNIPFQHPFELMV